MNEIKFSLKVKKGTLDQRVSKIEEAREEICHLCFPCFNFKDTWNVSSVILHFFNFHIMKISTTLSVMIFHFIRYISVFICSFNGKLTLYFYAINSILRTSIRRIQNMLLNSSKNSKSSLVMCPEFFGINRFRCK